MMPYTLALEQASNATRLTGEFYLDVSYSAE